VGQAFELGGAPFGVWFFKGARGEQGRTVRFVDFVFSLLDTNSQRTPRFFKLSTLGFQLKTEN
jgi:hypothetical protein